MDIKEGDICQYIGSYEGTIRQGSVKVCEGVGSEPSADFPCIRCGDIEGYKFIGLWWCKRDWRKISDGKYLEEVKKEQDIPRIIKVRI